MPSDCYNACVISISSFDPPQIPSYIFLSNPIHDYTGLNYMFQLNATFTMDAAKLGNEMRFMNDARVTNCQARGEDLDYLVPLIYEMTDLLSYQS